MIAARSWLMQSNRKSVSSCLLASRIARLLLPFTNLLAFLRSSASSSITILLFKPSLFFRTTILWKFPYTPKMGTQAPSSENNQKPSQPMCDVKPFGDGPNTERSSTQGQLATTQPIQVVSISSSMPPSSSTTASSVSAQEDPCGACYEGDCPVTTAHSIPVANFCVCPCCGLVPGVHY